MNRERVIFSGSRRLRQVPARVLLSLFTLCALSTAQAADWPMFRGNAARTGYTAEQAAPPLTKIWEFSVPDGIVSSPVVYNGRVYIGSRANKIYALDAATGALLWGRLAAGWVDSSPTVSGSTLYVSCLGGRLYAANRVTGALLWIVDIGAGSVSSPLVLNGRVYVGTGSPDNKLRVYDAATGALLAYFQAGQPVDSSPSTDGSSVYFGANDGKIYALDALTLALRWPAYPTLGAFGMNAVALSSGSLYALPGRDEKKALRLSVTDGALLASSPLLTQSGPWTQAGSPVLDGENLYFSAGAAEGFEADVQLAALSSSTLAAVWPSSVSLGGVSPIGVLASPAMANDVIYAATQGGRLLAVSSAGVPLVIKDADMYLDISSPSYSSPAISNGMVIVANYGGKVMGYKAGRHAAISLPAEGAIVNGTVSVRGYFANPVLAGYELEYSTGGGIPLWTRISSSSIASPAAGTELGVWDVSGLENGLYTIRLRVLESSPSGYDSSASLRVRVNAAPLPPSALSAADVPNDMGNAIALAWTASPTPGVSAYRIYRDDGNGYLLYASTPGSPYTDGAALTGLTYAYRVSSYDGWVESGPTEEVYAVSVNDSGDGLPPGAVGDLAAVPGFRGGTVALTWTATGDDGDVGEASYYLIRYSTDPAQNWGDFLSLAGGSRTVDGPAGITESEEAGGLFGGVTYYFAVMAVDDAGQQGNYSNIASTWAARDLLPPLPPGGLVVADAPGDEGGALDLAWALSPDDGSGAGDVYGYKVYRRTLNTSYVSSAPYASVAAGSGAYADPAATLNVRFYYAVAAFDSTNNSTLSGEASGISADNWRFFDAANGGAVRLPDGMEVLVPANSASQNDKIMVIRLDPVTYQPLFRTRATTQANPTDIVYEVKFQNPVTRLVAPAIVTLPYSDADVAGMVTENLRLYTLSGGAWSMLNKSSVDTQAKKVSAEVSHFSIFRIMEYVPSGEIFIPGEVYTYPNPSTGDTLTFKFRVAYKAYVKVEVFNVAGEKVASLEKADCPAGQASEIAWNVRGIASGIYIYRVEAQSSAGSKSVIKKLAVIH